MLNESSDFSEGTFSVSEAAGFSPAYGNTVISRTLSESPSLGTVESVRGEPVDEVAGVLLGSRSPGCVVAASIAFSNAPVELNPK